MKREGLARSGVVSLVGSAFAAAAALGLTVVVGNGIGASGTGAFFQAIGVATVLIQALKLGTNSAIVRSLAEQRALGIHGESWRIALVAVVPVIALSAVAALIVGMLSGAIAEALSGSGDARELESMLRFVAPYLVIASAVGVLQTFARMVRGVVAFTLLQNIILPAARLIAVVAAIWLGTGATGAVAAWLAPLPVMLVFTLVVIIGPAIQDWRRRSTERGSWQPAAADFWRFSSARGGGAALETAYEWADVILVGALASPAAAGVYAVVTRTVRAGQVVDRAMRVAVSPRISELLVRGDVDAARRLHTAVARLLILATWPFYLTLITLGPAVLAVFGPDFGEGVLVLAIIAATLMVWTAAGMLQSILLQGGHSSWQLGNKAVALVLSIGLNLILIPLLGLPGAAIAWTVSMLADLSLAVWQVHRRMGVRLEPARLLLAAALPIAVFGGGGLIARPLVGDSPLAAVITVAILSVVYGLAALLLRRRLGIDVVLRSLRKSGSAAPRTPVGEDAAQGTPQPTGPLTPRQ